ncbi:hypothetical protein VHEMI05894 [[Torrubiella] hemipterigena]|uniref:Cell wall protein n=1 Tax=[Torrubiella] hemipterigena TaxID=1531966 RepID=A0A0A1TI41_9HYPO|nr:hypothetical protein VHEMI05894 [[Torrubiella] hemipterigena]
MRCSIATIVVALSVTTAAINVPEAVNSINAAAKGANAAKSRISSGKENVNAIIPGIMANMKQLVDVMVTKSTATDAEYNALSNQQRQALTTASINFLDSQHALFGLLDSLIPKAGKPSQQNKPRDLATLLREPVKGCKPAFQGIEKGAKCARQYMIKAAKNAVAGYTPEQLKVANEEEEDIEHDIFDLIYYGSH